MYLKKYEKKIAQQITESGNAILKKIYEDFSNEIQIFDTEELFKITGEEILAYVEDVIIERGYATEEDYKSDELYLEQAIAVVLWMLGAKPSASTFIDEVSISYGYGNLCSVGVFDYPLPIWIIMVDFGALTWNDAMIISQMKKRISQNKDKNVVTIYTSTKEVSRVKLVNWAKENNNILDQEVYMYMFPESETHPDITYEILPKILQHSSKVVPIVTWDENIILQARLMAMEGKIDLVIKIISKEYDEYTTKDITLTKEGEVSDWPKGLFRRSFEMVRTIRGLQRLQAENNK